MDAAFRIVASQALAPMLLTVHKREGWHLSFFAHNPDAFAIIAVITFGARL